jgi:hypothetical protein
VREQALAAHVTGHTFVHARNTPLRSTQNGALLLAVAPPEYDVFLTRDKSIPFQHNLKRLSLAFVILHARSNKLEDLLLLVHDLLAALERISAGATDPAIYTRLRQSRSKSA